MYIQNNIEYIGNIYIFLYIYIYSLVLKIFILLKIITNEIDNNVVPKFKYLGSLVPDCSSDVQHRISMASKAFGRLRTIRSSKDVSIKLKNRLYGALILPIATYGSESCTTRRKK